MLRSLPRLKGRRKPDPLRLVAHPLTDPRVSPALLIRGDPRSRPVQCGGPRLRGGLHLHHLVLLGPERGGWLPHLHEAAPAVHDKLVEAGARGCSLLRPTELSSHGRRQTIQLPAPLQPPSSCGEPADSFFRALLVRPLTDDPTHSAAQILRLQSSYAGLRYDITCTVTKGDRSTSATGYLIVRTPPALPVITLDGLPSGLKVSPVERVVLGATVDSVAPDQLRLQWTQTAGPPLNLSDPAV